MKNPVFRWVDYGDRMPWHMGFAFMDFPRHRAACVVLPFNWPARWAYLLIHWLQYPIPRSTLRETRQSLAVEVALLQSANKDLENRNRNLIAANHQYLADAEARIVEFINQRP